MVKNIPKILIIWQTIGLTALTLILSACSDEKPEVEEVVARPVRYVVLESEKSQFSRVFSGTAQSSKESALSFKVAGTIEEIAVKVGDPVQQGMILANLDEVDLQVDFKAALANLKTEEADVKAAETNVNTTRSNYNRIEKLYETDNVSLSEFEQARGDFETALAQQQASISQVTTAQSKLQAARNQLEYATLKAPFEGVVNSISVEENEEMSPGEAVLTISRIDNLEVVVNLSDLFISRVEKGMKTTVTFPTLVDATFTGEITEIPFATIDSPTYPVTISVDTKDSRLRPGMTAEILFAFDAVEKMDNLYLPVDAVGEDSQGRFVFLLEQGPKNAGIARKRHVVVGALSERGFLVKEGVSNGDLIATSGLQLLLDGMNVVLLQDPIRDW